MSETASVTTSSLAITENRPARKSGGCVGIFFQLFDWNRRFAKKKLFSKRLLPPDRAKDASKKFGGDDKLPKLRLIADENSGGFPNKNKNGVNNNNNVGKNGGQTPSLVARLMGLDSMPSVKRDKLLKDSSSEFRGRRKEKVVGDDDHLENEISRQEFRPQKLQRTGTVDRRNVSRFGAEALQLKNVLSRSRKNHHPKLVTPVKNTSHHTKRNSSRLLGAATRILEPGLQGRNRSKYAITYPRSERIPIGNEFGSEPCKNCGNLVDIGESRVSPNSNSRYHCTSFDQTEPVDRESYVKRLVTNQQAQEHVENRKVVDVGVSSQSRMNCLPFNKSSTDGVNDTKDFLVLNKSLSGQVRSRVPSRVEDTKFDKRSKFDNKLSSGQKRHFTRIGKQGESSSNNRPRMVRSGTSFTVDRIGVGGNNNVNDMAFRFNSPMKNNNASSGKYTSRKKFTSNQINGKISIQQPFDSMGDSLSVLLEEKLTSQTDYASGINGVPPKRMPSNTFEELICALNMERRPVHQNNMDFSSQMNRLSQHRSQTYHHHTGLCLQRKSENARKFIGGRNCDHLSPGSVLEASFSNDSCCSSSLEDSSVRTKHADSMSYSYDESQFQDSESNAFYSGVLSTNDNNHTELVANLLTYITQVLYSIDYVDSRLKGNIRAHVKEVIFNSELVLASQIPHHPNKINSFFVCDLLLELDTLEAVMRAELGEFLGSGKSKTRYQVKRFVFDALIEYLQLKYGRYLKCGFRAWMNLPPFMGSDILIREAMDEVRRWMCFVGATTDELVESDMSHYLGKWTDFEIEMYGAGGIIEGDIFRMLIDEIVIEISTGIV
ncbi:uncharacterized protein [Rutidosis leptorrhynchoides]|uniref:uncharacterized protein n=1 Tax=Rutidosis leptorrhynchoides TaxID=125765 RepID=UPI003A9A2B3A